MRILALACFISIGLYGCLAKRYQPNWESIDSRPLPSWYDDAKIGIFIHWGVFTVPSFKSAWFWQDWKGVKSPDCVQFMKDNYPPGFTYPDFAPQFTTEFYDPTQWAKIFNASGAKYVVLTSKHHEGYTNWPSRFSWNWNSRSVGPHRDLVGELADAVRNNTNMHFGVYHSLFEWFNSKYLYDKANNFTTQTFVTEKTMPELYELVNKYKPDLIWSDGDWEASPSYWNSTNFLAWLYNESPVKNTVVTNDRWGIGTNCKHGGYYNCKDRYNPGELQKHKWENAFTIDHKAWGYRRKATLSDFMTTEELIATIAETISCGGNVLVNIGPTKEGTILPVFEERLSDMGKWLSVNGESIYGSKTWKYQNDTISGGVWYTKKNSDVYAIVLNWPKGNLLHLGAPEITPSTKVTMLGLNAGELRWSASEESNANGLMVVFPSLTPDLLPCKWAWVLKLTSLRM